MSNKTNSKKPLLPAISRSRSILKTPRESSANDQIGSSSAEQEQPPVLATAQSVMSASDEGTTEPDDELLDLIDDIKAVDTHLVETLEEEERNELPVEESRLSVSEREKSRKASYKLPQIFIKAPELKEIFDEGIYEVTSDPPFVTPYPDVDEMYQKANLRISKNATLDVFRSELRKIYEVVNEARSNEAELKKKLFKREHEVEELAARLKHDPRVAKVLFLAHRWRQEKAEAEEIGNEYLTELNSIRTDIRTMETNLTNMRKNNRKLTDELDSRKKLEKKMEELEELSMHKEQKIGELVQSMQAAKDAFYEFKRDSQKEKDELMAKLDAIPVVTHMDIEDTRHQLDVIKRENFKYHLELTDKRKMILNLEKTIHSNQTYMSELRKNLSTLKLKCKRLEDKLRRVNQSLEHCDNNREQLTQLAQNLNTENTRRGIHYKKMEASLKKCEMEKYHILNQAESQNKKVYQEEVRNKDLQSEINRLFFELSASRQLEDNMAKVLDKANKQILSLKNKLYISEAKANSGVAELNHQKNMLHTAKTHAENLGKNMQNLLTELKAVYYRMTSCTNENIEKKNIIRHMDALCHNFKNVIRIQDSENDSLVISSQKLEQLLRKSHDNMLVLRQKNAEAATEAHLQAELFSMLKYMLRFTETEKDTAVKIACKADHSIILLKQESAKRMHEILKLSEDVYAQKMLVKNFVKTLEHEKHENSHLIQMLHEADIEQQGLKRNYYALLQERDAFGVMVIQGRTRNDLLAKKMDAVYALLKAGFLESQQQIMDMRILKLEILNLRRKLQAYKGINFINNELRIELVDASRALQLEQDKRAAIEKMKMQVPHLHRYIQQARLSEYEMIQKIQKLQKMLIIKYKEISSRDNVIQRRNKALLELKLLLAKRPGVACYGELRATKSLLTKKDKEIKSLLAELNASRYEIHSKEQALEKLLAQMRSDKRQLAEYKRRAVNMPTLDVKQSAELSKRKLLSGCLTLNVTKPNLIKSTLTPLNLTSK